LLHQVGDLFELNVKVRCQNVKTPRFGSKHLFLLQARNT